MPVTGEYLHQTAFKLAVYYLGIPAANHAPFPVTRIRSTRLAQVFGGAGEKLVVNAKIAIHFKAERL